MEPRHFEQLAGWVEERLGLNLNRGGLVEALQAYAERSEGWLDLLEAPDQGSAEYRRLIDAVTVQHSWLFRDLQQLLVACSTLRRGREGSDVRQVWVPACASGEDAYSIAALCDAASLPFELLGSDVNPNAVEGARRAAYGPWATRSVPPPHQAVLTPGGPVRQVVARVRQNVRFVVHNLLDPPPRSDAPGGKWDLVVCRNVLIYLSRAHAARVLAHLKEALAPGGALVLGASDILAQVPADLAPREIEGRVVFERVHGLERTRRPARSVEPNLPRGAGPTPPPRQEPVASRNVAPAVAAQGKGPAGSGIEASSRERPVPSPALAQSEDPDVEAAISHLLDGIACHLSGDLQRAVTWLRAALFLMPRLWPAAYYLGLTYDALGRRDKARREYANAIRSIEEGRPLPTVAGQDFSFLQRDVAEIARRRGRGA